MFYLESVATGWRKNSQWPRCFNQIKQGICSSHLTLCLTLYLIFGYCSSTCPDLKITVYIFYWYHRLWIIDIQRMHLWPWYKVWICFLATPVVLCTIRNRMLINICHRINVDFCQFWGYWTSKNGSRDHDVKRN